VGGIVEFLRCPTVFVAQNSMVETKKKENFTVSRGRIFTKIPNLGM
jgi:hypothetical protein